MTRVAGLHAHQARRRPRGRAPGAGAASRRGDPRQQVAERPRSGRWPASAAARSACWSRPTSRRAASTSTASRHVINYDLPNEPESYVHRIGRTGARRRRRHRAVVLRSARSAPTCATSSGSPACSSPSSRSTPTPRSAGAGGKRLAPLADRDPALGFQAGHGCDGAGTYMKRAGWSRILALAALVGGCGSIEVVGPGEQPSQVNVRQPDGGVAATGGTAASGGATATGGGDRQGGHDRIGHRGRDLCGNWRDDRDRHRRCCDDGNGRHQVHGNRRHDLDRRRRNQVHRNRRHESRPAPGA